MPVVEDPGSDDLKQDDGRHDDQQRPAEQGLRQDALDKPAEAGAARQIAAGGQFRDRRRHGAGLMATALIRVMSSFRSGHSDLNT